MSLILDALRKLERDRDRPDPGVVVVGAVPWQGVGQARRRPLATRLALLAVAVLALGGAVLAGLWLARRPAAGSAAAIPGVARSEAGPRAAASTLAQTRIEARAAAPAPAEPAAAAAASAEQAAAAPVAGQGRSDPPALAASGQAQGSARLGPAPAPRQLAVPTPAAKLAEPAAGAAGPAASARQPLQLMAISERDGQPVAIISDHLVREGDSFEGVKVVRIGATEVEVDDHGQRRVLRF